MDKIIEWFISGSASVLVFSLIIILILFALLTLFFIAFIQGRSISFWPPKIGQKPINSVNKENIFESSLKAKSMQIIPFDTGQICKDLGILEIFKSRDVFQNKYPFSLITNEANPNSNFRIVGRTLFHILNRSNEIKKILLQGAKVDLCFFDMDYDYSLLKELAFFETYDTNSALSTFKTNFYEWFEKVIPSGNFEIRYHHVHLLESYFKFFFQERHYGIWDMSFGRDISAKRIFLLDITVGLGADLENRYQKIWDLSTPKFKYSDRKICIDNLGI